MWFDTSKTDDNPGNVKTIVFTKTAPTAGTYVTWTAPLNTTAYYDEDARALTYVLNKGYDKLVFNNDNLLKFGANIVPGLEPTDADVLAYWNEYYAVATGNSSYTSINELKNLLDGAYYSEIANALSEDNMFRKVTSITGLGLWDVSKVTDFSYIFKSANVSSLDLSGWDTSSAINMHGMFTECDDMETLTIDENFDTSNVTDMASMFGGCEKLISIPVTSFNTAKVEDMNNMFQGCKVATLIDVSGFNTSSVKDMSSMFNGCKAMSAIDLSSFNTTNVTDMSYMFKDCIILENIYVGANWTVGGVVESTGMFSMSDSVVKLPNYDAQSIDKTNAHTGVGGYLKVKPQ